MTRILGTERSDTDIVIARVIENYSLVADGNLAPVKNLGIKVEEAGDYLLESLVMATVGEAGDGKFSVVASAGSIVVDQTVSDSISPADVVQVGNDISTIPLAQGQHSWRMSGTVFGVPAGGEIHLNIGQQSGIEAFLILRGGFLRLTKL